MVGVSVKKKKKVVARMAPMPLKKRKKRVDIVKARRKKKRRKEKAIEIDPFKLVRAPRSAFAARHRRSPAPFKIECDNCGDQIPNGAECALLFLPETYQLQCWDCAIIDPTVEHVHKIRLTRTAKRDEWTSIY